MNSTPETTPAEPGPTPLELARRVAAHPHHFDEDCAPLAAEVIRLTEQLAAAPKDDSYRAKINALCQVIREAAMGVFPEDVPLHPFYVMPPRVPGAEDQETRPLVVPAESAISFYENLLRMLARRELLLPSEIEAKSREIEAKNQRIRKLEEQLAAAEAKGEALDALEQMN